jgi:hypothetical protein
MDVILEGRKDILCIYFLFNIISLLSGSQLMFMEMSPLLYDFAIDISKQVCRRFISTHRKNFDNQRLKHRM